MVFQPGALNALISAPELVIFGPLGKPKNLWKLGFFKHSNFSIKTTSNQNYDSKFGFYGQKFV